MTAALDMPIRSEAQARRDIAVGKARHMQPMTPEELALLTSTELADLAQRADGAADGWESDNLCYAKGYGARVRGLRKLAFDAGRRATVNSACFEAAVAASRVQS